MISMIVPCFWVNEELFEMTIECLNSLNDTTDSEPSEVLVVDDGSPIDTDIKDETDFKQQHKFLRLEKNAGYAGAVNKGLFHATGDIFIISNNDIVFIQHDWLEHLLKPLKEGYDISCIRTTDADGWNTEDRYEENPKFGSIWAMKRKVYDTLGGLDLHYGKGYFEDLDYRRKALNAGFKIVKNHAGLVEHKGKATFKVVDPEDRSYWEAKERYFLRWGIME